MPTSRSSLALAAVVIVLATVAAGCVGIVPGNDRGGGAFLSVERAESPTEGATVVDCGTLTDDQRSAFERAAGAPDGTAGVDGVETDPFVDHGYVRCDGRYYRVAVGVP